MALRAFRAICWERDVSAGKDKRNSLGAETRFIAKHLPELKLRRPREQGTQGADLKVGHYTPKSPPSKTEGGAPRARFLCDSMRAELLAGEVHPSTVEEFAERFGFGCVLLGAV
jgi:hypothetical protein